MKKIFAAAVGLVVLSLAAPANAADLAAAPYTKAPSMIAAIYDWSGFYIGANGGYGSSRKCFDLNGLSGGPIAPVREGCHDATGAVAGGQLGYRLQTGGWVFGVEAQGDWSDMRGSNNSAFSAAAAFPRGNRSRIDEFGLFTGQVGYAFNNALFYVKGGAAVTADRYEAFTIGPNGAFAAGATLASARETRWGGTAGVGLEYGFGPNWSGAIEYDHLFMGSRNSTFTFPVVVGPPTVTSDRIRQDVDLITVRVNYRWGGPVVAKY
jgi:outer membrane immunogenic protein